MDESTAAEIDKIAKEIERLQNEGDPENRVPDLSAYLRVLNRKLAMTLQQDPGRWGPSEEKS